MGERVTRSDYYEKSYYTRWYVMRLPGRSKVIEILDIHPEDYSYYEPWKEYSPDFQHPCADWCVEKLQGKFAISTWHICFEKKDDAMYFKLVWE